MRGFAIVTLAASILAGPATGFTQAQTPAIPEAMPFDIPYGAPIDLDDAHEGIIAAVNEAKKHNWKMSITVVDPSGNVIAHATMDGTQYASIAISQAKARTAALYRRPSKAFADAVNGASGSPSPATLSLLALNGGAASEGGYPVVRDGKLVGAIGASGGIATQDGATARAGLAAIPGAAN